MSQIINKDNIKSGQPVSADWMNTFAERIIARIQVGKGLQIRRVGEKIVIESTAGGVSAGTGIWKAYP